MKGQHFHFFPEFLSHLKDYYFLLKEMYSHENETSNLTLEPLSPLCSYGKQVGRYMEGV